jgi:hypothetical protein
MRIPIELSTIVTLVRRRFVEDFFAFKNDCFHERVPVLSIRETTKHIVT